LGELRSPAVLADAVTTDLENRHVVILAADLAADCRSPVAGECQRALTSERTDVHTHATIGESRGGSGRERVAYAWRELAADGSFTVTGDPNWSGVVAFTYRAVDAAGEPSDAVEMMITLAAVKDTPAAVVDQATVGATGSVTNDESAIDTDTDADGNVLSAELDSAPSVGAAVCDAGGTSLRRTQDGLARPRSPTQLWSHQVHAASPRSQWRPWTSCAPSSEPKALMSCSAPTGPT
jgi:hypothetical protein